MSFTKDDLRTLQGMFDAQTKLLRGEMYDAVYGVEARLHAEIVESEERLTARMDQLTTRMDQGFAEVNERFAEIDKRFVEVYEHIGEVYEHITDVANEVIVAIKNTTDSHGRRIKRLEQQGGKQYW